MKSAKTFVLSSLVTLIASGCVTTRSEMNERRQQGADSSVEDSPNRSSSVTSEDLNGGSSEAEPVASTTEPVIHHAPSMVPPAPPTSQYGLEEMRAELAKLSGKVEEMEQEKKSQQAAQTEEQNKLQQKISDLEKQLKEKEEQEKGPAVPEGKSALQAGKDALHAKSYDKAIAYFDAYLKTNESGKDAEEAYFLRGESYYQSKQYKKAIVDYSKFPEKFTKSKYSSKAMLKIAQCFEALEMKEDAKAFYQDLFDRYPKTVEGKLAKKKLTGKSSKNEPDSRHRNFL